MLKDYQDCKWLYLGESDIAQIVLRTNNGAKTINFGGDGEYQAYFDDGENIDIPERYKCVIDEECAWLWIYDDEERTQKINFKKEVRWRVYRSCEYGCIIQISEL